MSNYISTQGLAEIGWERGSNGLNTDNLAYKLRLSESVTQLTRNHQAQICGIVLEGGSDIVSNNKQQSVQLGDYYSGGRCDIYRNTGVSIAFDVMLIA